AVLVSGEHANQSGVSTSEVALLSQVVHRGGYTTLYFAKPLQNPRVRSSVSICANVVLATHGKTVSGEVLGSGDAGQKNQRFQLAQGPLTYLSDDSESGLKSTLSIRVSGVLWHPVSSLLAEDGRSRCYVVSHDADGHTTVTFGDGEHGARLPSGKDNVVATYRIGSGKDGEVSSGSLSILLSRPLGLRGVTNPIAAAGAEAAASAADILEEAPLSVATLGRAVSLSDYEVMAKLYPGIAKAYATAVRSAGAPAVHLTVASDDGQPLSASPTLRQGLMQTLLSLGDSTQPLFLDDYRPRYFRVALGIAVDSDYLADSVVALVSAALAQRFSFAAGDFGNSVRAADVLSVAQSVPGVLGAVLSGLWFDGSPQSKQLTLAAESARIDRGGLSCGAEILLILLDDSSVGVMP
ncbi:MAG TPA: putative baseplate assembly protein, partial [Pseudomonadota bacterium]|nr:putative baseplate assembly protein [Pseudomonadota bacterium]